MRSATFTVLAAALASVCSAAPAPATAGVLPAKFTLSYTTLDKTTVLPATSYIIGEPNYGFNLILKQPGKNSLYTKTEFYPSDTGIYVTHPEFTFNTWVGMSKPVNQYHFDNVNLFLPVDLTTGTVRTTGIGMSSTGSLTWDLADGAGPQNKWTACDINENYQVTWDMTGSIYGLCFKIDLKVHAV